MSQEEAVEVTALDQPGSVSAPMTVSHATLGRVIGGLLLALVVTCWPLFTSRSFPHLGLISVPDLFHLLCAALLVLCALLLLVGGGDRRLLLGTAGVLLLSVVIDELRLQPWAFEIFVLLLLMGVCRRDKALAGARLYVVGLYLWAGLHKANGEFLDQVVPWFGEPFDLELSGISALAVGGGIILLEMGGGLALLVPRCRRIAVVGLVVMHFGALVVLGPWGHDWDLNVWPWNLGQALLVWLLFWHWKGSGIALFRNGPRAIVVIGVLLPAFHLIALWPANLSHAVYAGNYAQAGFLVRRQGASAVMRGGQKSFLAAGLPPPLSQVLASVGETGGTGGWSLMHVDYWAVTELGATIPPDARVSKRLFRAFCERAREPEDLRLVLRPKRTPLVSEDQVIVLGCDGKERGRLPLPESWPR